MNTKEQAIEKPLSRPKRALLVLGVGAVMALFYLFSILAALLLSVLTVGEIFSLLASARFAGGRLIMPLLTKHAGLLMLFVKNFWLQGNAGFKILLRREDAPALYEMLSQLCQRLTINFPQEIVLQMHDTAWVKLEGMRQGSGKVTLGVGYDLLAGLTIAEVETVLAHEMMHAKLINRSYRNWIFAGQTRLRIIALALNAEVEAARRAKKHSYVAKFLFIIVDWFVRPVTSLVAAYSRQNEFDADLGAARLCGVEVTKSSLSKVESLHRVVSGLAWNERMAHLQQRKSYSQWLLQEITHGTKEPSNNSSHSLFDRYSTHPSIPDRLAALSSDGKAVPVDSPSGIQLFARPDDIAIRLASELQRFLVQKEEKESRALEKFYKNYGRCGQIRYLKGLGLFFVLVGLVFLLAPASSRNGATILHAFGLTGLVVGLLFMVWRDYQDRFEMPAPSYFKLTHPPAEISDGKTIRQREEAIEVDLRLRFNKGRKSKRAILLAKESYAALEKCDYLRAHVAGRACLKLNNRSVEGALAVAVASASFRQMPNVINMLSFVHRRAGFRSFSTIWGSAWATLLAGDFARAEAMLEETRKLRPQQMDFVMLLAVAQFRRGKLQSSILNARKACEMDPHSKEKIKFLIARLLDAGFTQEAQEWFKRVESELNSDPDLMLALTQLHLLQQNLSEAQQMTQRLTKMNVSPQTLVVLGKLYEIARLKDQAAGWYQQAVALGHYPEAHLGLGRIEAERKNKTEAQRHIWDALNLSQPLGKHGLGTMQILQPILTQILNLQELAPKCHGWIASFPKDAKPSALVGLSFVIYAPKLSEAQNYLSILLEALEPGKPLSIPAKKNWKTASRSVQPHGLVRPGVHRIWN